MNTALSGLREAIELDLLKSEVQLRAAPQQPDWANHPSFTPTRGRLEELPELVSVSEIAALWTGLADAALGNGVIIQAGDCAESLWECNPQGISRRLGLVVALGDFAHRATGLPTVQVGRMGGQCAKPRSSATEWIDGVELPSYRGDMVNGDYPDAESRRHDPERMLTVYKAAARVTEALRSAAARSEHSRVWSSHEALVLDYELPFLRAGEQGKIFLASTHWPWIGNRTNSPDGAHVELLSRVANPVACKVGPDMSVDKLLALCAKLDPLREPGRLTLISRIGHEKTTAILPELVREVRRAGHPVIWMNDPMHGNTVTGPHGRKTRYLEHILAEVRDFLKVVRDGGAVAGGLHLEATIDDVAECHPDSSAASDVLSPRFYTSLCDPRLTIGQAMTVIEAWSPR